MQWCGSNTNKVQLHTKKWIKIINPFSVFNMKKKDFSCLTTLIVHGVLRGLRDLRVWVSVLQLKFLLIRQKTKNNINWWRSIRDSLNDPWGNEWWLSNWRLRLTVVKTERQILCIPQGTPPGQEKIREFRGQILTVHNLYGTDSRFVF